MLAALLYAKHLPLMPPHVHCALAPALPAGELRAADPPDGEAGGGGGGTGRQAAAREEQLRRTLQVYLAAWLLCAEVDERRLEAHLAAVRDDMRGF